MGPESGRDHWEWDRPLLGYNLCESTYFWLRVLAYATQPNSPLRIHALLDDWDFTGKRTAETEKEPSSMSEVDTEVGERYADAMRSGWPKSRVKCIYTGMPEKKVMLTLHIAE